MHNLLVRAAKVLQKEREGGLLLRQAPLHALGSASC